MKTFDVSSGIPVKLASEIWPQFKILLKTKKFLFLLFRIFFSFVSSFFLFASGLKKDGWGESRSKTDPESVWRALEV